MALTQATRRLAEVIDPALAEYVEFGASPRGAIALQQVGRAHALMHGRTFVLPDDLRALRHAVFRHRLHLGFQAVADGIRVEDIIDAVFAVIRARDAFRQQAAVRSLALGRSQRRDRSS